MLRRIASIGLLGRILLILALVMATEFVANTFLFERANQFALRDDEAQRMAEHLVIAHRLLERTPRVERRVVAAELSTKYFRVGWTPVAEPMAVSFGLTTLRNQIADREPELAQASLRLYLQPLSHGGDIIGSMELPDRSVIVFHNSQASALWSLTFGRVMTFIAPTLVLVLLGGIMIRLTMRPLHVLIRATKEVGEGTPEPVPEQGPAEIRSLVHAFNAMHERIHRLISTRTQALAAVGHDLRTPLARLQLRLDGADVAPEAYNAMSREIEEMTDLLRSLQIYLSGEGASAEPVRIDLAAMAETLIDSACDMGQDAVYQGPSSLEVMARAVPIRRALANLIDNAVHYGGNARLTLRREGEVVVILIEDDGPGIEPERLADVMQPFVRLDESRGRNTRGMGLGLAIVSDAVRAEGGQFSLENRSEGGLRATVRLPLPTL